MTYIEVVFPLPLDRSFIYETGADPAGIGPGSRVLAPFRNKLLPGFILQILSGAPTFEVRKIERLLDDSPLLFPDLLQTAFWMSQYYLVPLGEVLSAMLPSWVQRPRRAVRALPQTDLPPGQESGEFFQLTPDQEKALAELRQALSVGEGAGADSVPKRFLLHGVTGSGKTEVYIRLVREVLNQGKSALLLLPEIVLTPQIIGRFSRRFAEPMAVFHSSLTDSQRAQQWFSVYDGSARLVIGTRSAVFAPLRRVGIVIMDEEHEHSYKQDSTPRYHARDVARQRAEFLKCPLLLGSATPSLETFDQAQRGEIRLLTLPERVGGRPLPQLFIEDVNQSHRQPSSVDGRPSTVDRRWSLISPTFVKRCQEALGRGEQVLLFINRRGYATFLYCPACRYVLRCSRCDVALIFHKDKETLQCHHCHYAMEPVRLCPHCRQRPLQYLGSGTQKVEDLARRLFPHVELVRMDSDEMSKAQDYDQAIAKLWSGQAKILVGTQMVAKGLDFPQVRLCGILGIDMTLSLEDFRSAERAFQLIHQVSGRTGRAGVEGEVFLETLHPDHYAIRHAAQNDYLGFFHEECRFRKTTFYPPYSVLTKISIEGKKEEEVVQASHALAQKIRQQTPGREEGGEVARVELLGPALAPLKRLKNRYRYQMILKTDTAQTRQRIFFPLRSVLFPTSKVKITLDVDPLTVL